MIDAKQPIPFRHKERLERIADAINSNGPVSADDVAFCQAVVTEVLGAAAAI